MRNEQSRLWRAPIVIWCIRIVFAVIIYFISSYWLKNGASALTGKLIFGAFIGISGVALIASFIRSKFSLALVIVSVIVVPLAFFLSLDAFMLNRTWWDWCIAFPFALVIQMAIPVVVAWYMLKAPNVREHFGCGIKNGMHIRIKETPPGEAPENIRQAWVGLVLPVLPQFSRIRTHPGFGVLTGPKTQFGLVLATILGRGQKQTGYIVEAKTAVELLASHSKDAAEWWRQNAPQFLKPKFYFLFSADSCEEIESKP
jgi:hypothetical protein